MPFDIEQHKKDREKYILTMLEIVENAMREDPSADATCIGPCEAEIAERSGLTRQQVSRICEELDDEGVAQITCATKDGRSICFTTSGLKAAEKIRYDKSLLAKKRKAIEWAKEGGVTLSKKAFVSLCGAVASLGIFAAFKEQIIRWAKHLLGF